MRLRHAVLGMIGLIAIAGCGGSGGSGSSSSSSGLGGSSGGGGSTATGPLTVAAVDPADGSQPSSASAIRVVFDHAVDPSTVILDTSNLARTTVLVAAQAPGASQATIFAGTVAASGSTLTFTPQSAFAAGWEYAIALTSGIHDANGTALTSSGASGPLTLQLSGLVFQASFGIATSGTGGTGTGGTGSTGTGGTGTTGGSGTGTTGGTGTGTTGGTSTVAEIDVDANRDGVVNAADQAGKGAFSTGAGAVFYWDVADENGDAKIDSASTEPVPGASDPHLAPVFVRQSVGLASNATVTIAVSPSGAQAGVRIFRLASGAWSKVYTGGASFTLPASALAAGDIELGLMGVGRVTQSWTGNVDLVLTVADASGATLGTDAVHLQSAPNLFCNNLWPIEQCAVVDIPQTVGGQSEPDTTVALVNAVTAACSKVGATATPADGTQYNQDRWIQDSHETGAVYLPASGGRRRESQCIQLARFGDIDAWCESLLDVDFGWVAEFGNKANADSPNFGGNLEIAPPYALSGGASYPWGRIVTGGGTDTLLGTSTTNTRGMDPAYLDFFAASHWQGPAIQIETEWLDVGHVDEIVSFVPAPNTTRGYVVALASPTVAKNLLQTAKTNGYGTATVFAGRTANAVLQSPNYQTTVNAILADTTRLTYSSQAQARIDNVRAALTQDLGLAANEIVDLPVLFEDIDQGYAAAYNPGVVNMVPITGASSIQLLVPDPEGPLAPTDPWKNDIKTKLEALGTAQRPVQVTFVDVFLSYHVLVGEAHCGTNYVRTPPATDWWDKP